MKILEKTRVNPEILGFVAPGKMQDNSYLGNESQLHEIVSIHKIDELVFCSENIDASNIIKNMTLLNDFQLEYKIAPPESHSIIGSNSINTAGDLYMIHFNSISNERNKRLKRLFDLFLSIFFIAFAVFLFPFVKNYGTILKSAFKVLAGKYTWISYCNDTDISSLPKLKKGIYDIWPNINTARDKKFIEKLNIEYARAYYLSTDFRILWKNIL